MLLCIGRIDLQRGEALDGLEEHAAQIGVAAPIIAHGAAGDFLHGHNGRWNERHAYEQRHGGRKRQRRKRYEQCDGGKHGIEQLGHILAEIALELLGALDAHLHGNARCDGFVIGRAKSDELIVNLLANGAFRLSGRALPHALRRCLACHAHRNSQRGSGKHANRNLRRCGALKRQLQKLAHYHEQRDVAHQRNPLEAHVGKNIFCGAWHHSKQAFIEHFSPVFRLCERHKLYGVNSNPCDTFMGTSENTSTGFHACCRSSEQKARRSGTALRNGSEINPHARARRPRHRSPWQ